MADAHTNFAYGTVLTAPIPATSGTSLTLSAGAGALCPSVPFNATVWPTATTPLSTNAEIVRVTVVVGDVLTITRAQEGTSARTILVGDQFAVTITAKTLTDAELSVSDGVASVQTGTLRLSNSNGISFGLNGQTLTASHNALTSQSNQALSAGNGSFTFQSASFSNANGVSFSTAAGSAIVASHDGLTSQSQQAASAANGSFAFQTLSFSNVNGISFVTTDGSAIQASHNALTSQSNQNITAGNGGFAFQTLSFSDANGVSFGTSAGSAITASYTRPVVSNAIQAVGSATGSGTNTSRFAADDHVHEGVFSAGVTNAGNTIGDTRVGPGRFVLQGGNNVTLSQITAANAFNTIIISGANAGGAQTGISGLIASDATYTSGSVYFSNQANVTIGSSVDGASQYVRLSVHAQQTGISGLQVSDATYTSGTVTFRNANGISFGSSGANGVSASYTVPSVAGLLSAINLSAGTTSNNLSAVTFSNANGVSFGLDGSTVTGSHNALTSQSNQNVTADNGGFAFQTLSFSNLNGISFGTSAGSAITASHNGLTSQSNQAVTAANGSFAFQTLSFSNTHGFTFATSAGSAIVGSYTVPTVPAQLSVGVSTGGNTAGDTGVFTGRVVFVGSDNITLSGSSNAGSATVSVIGGAGAAGVTYSGYTPLWDRLLGGFALGNGSLMLSPWQMPNVQFDRIVLPMNNTNATNSSGSHTLSFHVGMYTQNVSTLSLVFSASTSTAVTHSGTAGSYSLYSGMRLITIPLTTTLAAGNYVMGVISSTASAGANGSYSLMVNFLAAAITGFSGHFGSANNASIQFGIGEGVFTAATNGLPASVGLSDMVGTNALNFRYPAVGFVSGTV